MEAYIATYNNIRLIRTLRKISAKSLAKKTGYSQAYISRLECGKRRLNTQVLYRLSTSLDCSMYALINRNLSGVVQELQDFGNSQYV